MRSSLAGNQPPLFQALLKRPMLLWIYRSAPIDGGAKAVADFLLAHLTWNSRRLLGAMVLDRLDVEWSWPSPGWMPMFATLSLITALFSTGLSTLQ